MDESHIIKTQIIPRQRRHEILSRPRLLQPLLENILDCKLSVVISPAGYGKTSLLIDLAATTELPVCWYSIDEVDNDASRFLLYVVAAISRVYPQFGQRSRSLIQNMQDSSPDSQPGVDCFVATFVNEIYDTIDEHFMLILDDFHLVHHDPIINNFIDRLVLRSSENVHLIIASRELLAFQSAISMVSHSLLGGLNDDALKFQPQEVQNLLLQNHKRTISHAQAEILINQTEGWVTGLLFATQEQSPSALNVFNLSVYDYMAQEVLDMQSPYIQDFLLRSSLLGEFDPELCRITLGPGDWLTLIQRVTQDNLFVQSVGHSIRYHHLFETFLRQQMAAKHPNETKTILYKLAEVYEQQHQWEKVFNVYNDRLKDQEITADLIERVGPILIDKGRISLLNEWFKVISPDLLISRSRLNAIRGFTNVVIGKIDEGLQCLLQAEANLRDDSAYHLSLFLVWKSSALRFQGKYQDAENSADEALQLIKTDTTLQTRQAQALRAKGSALRHQSKLDDAVAAWEKALRISFSFGEIYDTAVLQLELAIIYADLGLYNKAMDYCIKSMSYWQEVGDVIRQSNVLNNIAIIHYFKGEYYEAKENLEAAITLAQESDYAYVESMALASIGDLYLDLDDFDAALLAYNKTYQVAQRIKHGFLTFYSALGRVTVHRIKGDIVSAQTLLKQVYKITLENNSNHELGLYKIEEACLSLANQDLQSSLIYLQEATRLIGHNQRKEIMQTLLYLATTYHKLNDLSSAKQCLTDMFEIVAKLENKHSLVVIAQPAHKVLEMFQNSRLGPQITQLMGLIRDFEQTIPHLRRVLRRQTNLIPISPPQLRIQGLGQTQVIFGNKTITGEAWQNSQLMREYFYYLIAHPQGITRDNIGLVFSPNVSFAQPAGESTKK